MNQFFKVLTIFGTFAALAACTTSSGITYSIRDVRLANGQPANMISCDGLIGSGEMCRKHAEEFCNGRGAGNRVVPIEDAGPLGRTADGKPNTRVMLFRCAVPQAPTPPVQPQAVRPPAPAPAPVVIHKMSLSGDTSFDTGSSTLRPAAIQKLNRMVADAHGMTVGVVRVDGYTDSTGSAELNLALSKARAQRVAQYLQDQGLKARSFEVTGYGKDDPVASNATAEGRAQNRRVEISSTDR